MRIENADGSALAGLQLAASAVFGQVFGITSSNFAALGPTGAFRQSQLDTIPVVDTRTEDIFSQDVKLQYEVNDDLMTHISYAKGDKSGGFDFRTYNKGQPSG